MARQLQITRAVSCLGWNRARGQTQDTNQQGTEVADNGLKVAVDLTFEYGVKQGRYLVSPSLVYKSGTMVITVDDETELKLLEVPKVSGSMLSIARQLNFKEDLLVDKRLVALPPLCFVGSTVLGRYGVQQLRVQLRAGIGAPYLKPSYRVKPFVFGLFKQEDQPYLSGRVNYVRL